MSLIGVQLARSNMFRDAAEVKDAGTTIRPPSTAMFGVDSDDRYKTFADRRTSASYPFSFSINKSEALLNGFFTRLAVSEIRMAWTLPNISAAWGNNTLTYYESATPGTHTITIPDGFYDLASLTATIEALVQAQGFLPSFTAAARTDGSTVYATNTADTFYWVQPTSSFRTLYDMLNLITFSPPLVVPQTSYLGGIANLKSTDFVDIVSPQLTYNQDLKDGSTSQTSRDVLCRIYLDDKTKSLGRITTNLFTAGGAPNGFEVPLYDPSVFTNGCTPFIIYRQFPYPKQILWNEKQPLGNITFEMYDDQGRSIQTLWNSTYPVGDPQHVGEYYANSFVWNMTLLITEN